ncbi:MAG: 50S ribosomal protein L17 [Candidatus Pacebacteria bacterium]|nr:50S ribosomal protein L17 [Candidatus Paceibacterota bacterium]
MRKKVKGRILSREKGQRDALLNSLARGIVLNGKIKTTEAKAKEVSRFFDKQITIAKGQDLHARRNLMKNFSPDVAKKMVEELAVKYKDRSGGYTRITKVGPRKTDGAKMAFIELV